MAVFVEGGGIDIMGPQVDKKAVFDVSRSKDTHAPSAGD
jgi:hypothetical protein